MDINQMLRQTGAMGSILGGKSVAGEDSPQPGAQTNPGGILDDLIGAAGKFLGR